jgi:hypothetical protein
MVSIYIKEMKQMRAYMVRQFVRLLGRPKNAMVSIYIKEMKQMRAYMVRQFEPFALTWIHAFV